MSALRDETWSAVAFNAVVLTRKERVKIGYNDLLPTCRCRT